MASEELQKLMDHLLTQQAKMMESHAQIKESYAQIANKQAQIDEKHIRISNLIEFIAEQQAKADVEIAEVRATTLDLVRSIGIAAIQAEADRQIINNRMKMFELQAEKDRAEMRERAAELHNEMREGAIELHNEMREGAIELRNEMREGFAELRNIVAGLANIAGSTIRKVNDIDERVGNLEQKK